MLWNNTKTKSLELSKRLIETGMESDKDIELPIVNIKYGLDTFDITVQEKWNNSISFSIYSFVSYSKEHMIPMRTIQDHISETNMHRHITGIHKKNATDLWNVQFMLDKITILKHARKRDTTGTPYYDMAIDQLIEELSLNKNIDHVEKINTINSESIMEALSKTNGIILELKEQLEEKQKKEKDEQNNN